MDGFKPRVVASKVFKSGHPCRALGRRRGAPPAPLPPPGSSHSQSGVLSQEELNTQADIQALQQEQVVFERNNRENDALFRLQMTMGWSTFVIAPVGVVAVIIYPPALVVVVPLLSAAVWNWRRILARGGTERTVITKRRRDRD